MTDLYKELILELERRKVADARTIGPFYISAIGTHMLNLINQIKTPALLTEGGMPVDLRQHILYVAPPGFGKSYYVKQFTANPAWSLLRGIDNFPVVMKGTLTEAGLVGSVDQPTEPGGSPRMIYGLAGADGKRAIVGMEEFASITNSMTLDYNATLGTTLLTMLDGGMVSRTMKNGVLEYQTYMTWWVGTQPARIDLASGLARRFVFITKFPRWQDFDILTDLRTQSREVKITPDQIKTLHGLIDTKCNEIKQHLQKIVIHHGQFTKFFKIHRIIHYEQPIYERMAIGYWVMKENIIRDTLNVTVDAEVERLFMLEIGHRKMIKQGAIQSMVWHLIKDFDTINKKKILDMLLDLSVDYDESNQYIKNLIIMGYLSYNASTKELIIKKK